MIDVDVSVGRHPACYDDRSVTENDKSPRRPRDQPVHQSAKRYYFAHLGQSRDVLGCVNDANGAPCLRRQLNAAVVSVDLE